MESASKGVLHGLRIVEVGHYIAAPFATRLLADLGADVIKVEPPTGDPVRQWGDIVNGKSLFWSMHGRNKRCVTLDLKSTAGQETLLKLVASSDAVVENFRPGQLAKLKIGPDELRRVNPRIVIAQVSGYGQTGPRADRAAFGVIGEALGGLRYLTNHASGVSDLPPVRVGVSIGDSIAGLYAAFGVMAALWQRDRVEGDGASRTIDVALTESVLSMMEGMLPEFGRLGKVKQPMGGGIATAAPTNAYPTHDQKWVLIAANSDPLFARLSKLIGMPQLSTDSRYSSNGQRVANSTVLDKLIGEWTKNYTADALLAKLEEADIPSSKVYTAEDCAMDEQFRARGMIREIEDTVLGTVLQAGIVPHIPEEQQAIRWTGPAIGEHNGEVFREIGLSLDEIDRLTPAGIA